MTHTLELLARRRSVPAHLLAEPGPDEAQLAQLLKLAARVPDHGKLVPWRFIVFEGEARHAAGERLAELVRKRNPEIAPDRLEEERTRFSRSPLCVAVIRREAPHPKIPLWEQTLSAGAVCLNLEIAAHAMGFAAVWLTEWLAEDKEALALYGVGPDEAVAGFIHIGTPTVTPTDRPRPVMEEIVTRWQG
jgi:nitroreductase